MTRCATLAHLVCRGTVAAFRAHRRAHHFRAWVGLISSRGASMASGAWCWRSRRAARVGGHAPFVDDERSDGALLRPPRPAPSMKQGGKGRLAVTIVRVRSALLETRGFQVGANARSPMEGLVVERREVQEDSSTGSVDGWTLIEVFSRSSCRQKGNLVVDCAVDRVELGLHRVSGCRRACKTLASRALRECRKRGCPLSS